MAPPRSRTDHSPADTVPVREGQSRVQARNSTMVIHASVRKMILFGDLLPGSPVPQASIAQQFGVSRGPVREALRLLEREGLVEAKVNQRPRVTGLSAVDLDQLYAMRIADEALAIHVSVTRFSAADLECLPGLLDQLDTTREELDMPQHDSFHHEFHRHLVKHSGPRIVAHLDRLYDHAERYRRLYRSSATDVWPVASAEHREIARACENGEAVLASQLLARHLARTALTVLTLMEPRYQPSLVRTALQPIIGVDAAAALTARRSLY